MFDYLLPATLGDHEQLRGAWKDVDQTVPWEARSAAGGRDRARPHFPLRGGIKVPCLSSRGTASGTHTQLIFVVRDIEAEIGHLRANGVTFEKYDLSDLKNVAGVATTKSMQAAWFRDSEGNLLGLVHLEAEDEYPKW
ncbi:MAG: VOC family protein [Actinomycetota bacterium]